MNPGEKLIQANPKRRTTELHKIGVRYNSNG